MVRAEETGYVPSPYRNGGDVLRGIARSSKRQIAIGTPLGIVNSLGEAFTPVGIGIVVDQAIAPRDGRMLVLTLALLVGVMFISVIAWRLQFAILRAKAEREAHRLRLEVAEAVLDPRARRTSRSAGEILSISTSDADRAARVLQLAEFSIPVFLSFIVAMGVLFVFDVWLGVATLAGAVLVVLVIRLLSPPLVRRHEEQQEAGALASGMATDLVQGLRVVQGLGVQTAATRRYFATSRTALVAARANARFSGLNYGASLMAGSLMIGALTAVAGAFALNGRLGIGEFITTVGLTRFMIGPILVVGETTVGWASSKASAGRIGRLINDLRPDPVAGPEDVEGTDPARDRAVAARDASDRGPLAPARAANGDVVVRARETDALVDVDITARQGEILGIVCATPRETRELLDILAGRFAGGGADAWIGSTRIAAASALALRETMLHEPHHVDLFEGTLRDAITLGRLDATADDVARAVSAASADDLVELLEDGLDTVLLERGVNLSGGQKQRVALARALVANRPALVLHDPTSAVDAVTEQAIAVGLAHARRRAGLTTIVLTSSPTILAVCDRVVLVEGGSVRADAHHRELAGHLEYEHAVRR